MHAKYEVSLLWFKSYGQGQSFVATEWQSHRQTGQKLDAVELEQNQNIGISGTP